MKLRFVLFCLLLIFFLLPSAAFAVECDLNQPIPADTENLGNYIQACQKKIDEKRGQAGTLKATIDVLNSQIRLTQAQIKQTSTQIVSLEKDVSILTTVVTDLDKELSDLTRIFLARVRDGYVRHDPDVVTLFLSSDSFAKFFTRLRYVSVVKTRDQLVLAEIQNARKNYDKQKQAKVTKQQEVEQLKTKLVVQQNDLSAQQRNKKDLLIQTQNDEARYQSLLSQARSELEAINAIIAGNGNEVEIKEVNKGDVIASLIYGASCNSGGTHLHFIVADNTVVGNPFSFLKFLKPDENLNCSGVDGAGHCFDGDPFNPTGSWDWPLSVPVQLNQGYGSTWAVRNTWVGSIYSFHNGLDINSSSGSLEVKAVQPGKLFRGTYSGKNSCALKYVHVKHKDSNQETFYLHVNFN